MFERFGLKRAPLGGWSLHLGKYFGVHPRMIRDADGHRSLHVTVWYRRGPNRLGHAYASLWAHWPFLEVQP